MKLKTLLLQFILCLSTLSSWATDYFITNTGDDANTGTSPAQAWQTVARISTVLLQPGDRVLLAGGQTFTGSIRVQRGSRGTAAQPIIFRSYGPGRAVIASGSAAGFLAQNMAGIELRNLAFAGAGRLANTDSGVIFYNDSTNAHLNHLRFDSLDVSGYQGYGLNVASWNGTSGYDDVRITNCQLHANGEGGLTSYAYFPLIGHHNWYVSNCTAYDNSGRPEISNMHTGSGLILSGIDGAIVEHCTAYHNGWLNARGGGPSGIWGWDCNNLVIQYCESHHNEAGGQRDGGGFDLDGGCTNSVLQYNYSHDNDGPGYLLVQFDYARPMNNLTVRYNVSVNDGKIQEQGGILVYSSGWDGGITNADIYNNTIILDRPANGSSPNAIYLLSGDISNITVRNNIFQVAAGLRVVRTFTTTGVRFEGNDYWSPGGSLAFNWNGAGYGSLAAWRAGTGQEMLDNGTRPTGMNAAPVFASASSGQPPYSLDATSPLLGQGLDLASEFGVNPGPHDFYGLPTPLAGTRGNIGASEARPDRGQPLPVQLISFTAEPLGTDVVLRWATASEQSNDRFEVEASIDGRVFRRIGQVRGQGNSVQRHDYRLVDPAIARYAVGQVFYRLRQVDHQGTASYSPVRAVRVNQPAGLALFPNPTTRATTLTGAHPGTPITVLDAVGRHVLSATVDATGTASLVMPDGLAAGVYIVRVGPAALRLQLQ